MLTKLLYGYKATQCLYVAAKLNIADHLQSGYKSISELATLTKTKIDPLSRVMRCLVSLGIFQEDAPNTFSLNLAANDLLSESESTMKDFIILCGEDLYRSAGELLYTVQTGLPAFDHIYGMNFWNHLEKNPEKAALFHTAMEKGTSPIIKEIIAHYDFSAHKHIIDIGGGKGHLVCEILFQYSNAIGTVYDLPNAKNSATEYISKNNLSDRCQIETGNFFVSIPSDADIYLLKVVLHDWDDKSVNLILQNCRKAMSHSSKLLIIEKLIDDDQYKSASCLSDINMLVTCTGKERTLLEFQQLLSEAGLKYTRRISTGSIFSIIEAEIL